MRAGWWRPDRLILSVAPHRFLPDPPDFATLGRREVIQMTTQVTNKGGFANNFWLQTLVLFIVVGFLIAIAAKFVW
jgi:hypothetical protein